MIDVQRHRHISRQIREAIEFLQEADGYMPYYMRHEPTAEDIEIVILDLQTAKGIIEETLKEVKSVRS